MNDNRRKKIEALRTRLDAALNLDEMREIQELASSLAEEEQEYYDNMPENLQQGDKGQNAESAASDLSAAADAIESALDSLEEALGKLEESISY